MKNLFDKSTYEEIIQRMNTLTGDSKFMDVLERSLYNAARDGLSLSGDRFF